MATKMSSILDSKEGREEVVAPKCGTQSPTLQHQPLFSESPKRAAPRLRWKAKQKQGSEGACTSLASGRMGKDGPPSAFPSPVLSVYERGEPPAGRPRLPPSLFIP